MPEPAPPLFRRARALAAERGHGWIDVGHLLLAALAEDGIHRRLVTAGLDVAALDRSLEAALPPAQDPASDRGQLPLAPAVKTLLEALLARLESEGRTDATTIDLLRAALATPPGSGPLARHGVRPEHLGPP